MICFLLLHFSVQCYLLQLNLIIFQGNLKKKVKLLIQIMLITFAAPRPNDPNVYGDWPWTNGGNTIGGSHNNGNSGWGYPHNNGYYGKRDTGKCIHWSIILMVSLSRYVVVVGFSIHNQGVFLSQYNADFFLLLECGGQPLEFCMRWTIPPPSPPPLRRLSSPSPFIFLPIHPFTRLISYISFCITSVICLLLLDFSLQCYLLQLNLIIFQGNLKKKVKLLIQIMLITFAAPRPNDPNVYGDWPWTNGGNTIGGSHNNGNSGWGYPHNNGYYGKRDIGKCIHWSIILMVSLGRYVVVDGFSIHNQGVFLPQYNADFLPVPIMWWAASGGFAWDPSRHHPFPPPPLSSPPSSPLLSPPSPSLHLLSIQRSTDPLVW